MYLTRELSWHGGNGKKGLHQQQKVPDKDLEYTVPFFPPPTIQLLALTDLRHCPTLSTVTALIPGNSTPAYILTYLACISVRGLGARRKVYVY